MAKVLAKDYFDESILFDAEVLDGGDNRSATSSGVTYELMCKRCKAVTQRTGNSKALNTCAKCKYVWDREHNEARKPGWSPDHKEKSSREVMGFAKSDDEDEPIVAKPKMPSRKAVAAIAPREEEKSPVTCQPCRKITVDSISKLLTGKSQEKPAVVAAPVTKPINYGACGVGAILDYCDERLTDSWRRCYYVPLAGHEKPVFVLDDDFIDTDMVKNFENSLPELERFKVMFPKESRKNKGSKHAVRSRIDVLSEHGYEQVEVVEPIAPAAFAPPTFALPPTPTPTPPAFAPPTFALPATPPAFAPPPTPAFTLPAVPTPAFALPLAPPLIPVPTLSETTEVAVRQSTFTHVLLRKGQVYKIGDIIIEAI